MQPLKAEAPIDVTLLGMVMEVRPVQPLKAPTPIDVTLLGIVDFLQPTINEFVSLTMIALQLSRESYLELSLDTVIVLIPLQ